MKRILLSLLYVALLCSCDSQNKPTSLTKVDIYNVDQTTIEGCEYLVTYGYAGRPCLAHKGNCKSEFHKLQ